MKFNYINKSKSSASADDNPEEVEVGKDEGVLSKLPEAFPLGSAEGD